MRDPKPWTRLSRIFPVVNSALVQLVTLLTGFSPVLIYGDLGASEADSGIGSGRGGGVGGGTRK